MLPPKEKGSRLVKVTPLIVYVRKPFPFFLSKELQKEPKTAWKSFASAEATKGAALGARKLLKKFDQNFSSIVVRVVFTR